MSSGDLDKARLKWSLNIIVLVGFFCTLLAPLLMLEPMVKIPIASRIFDLVPDLLPRSVNPNYVGGTLSLFIPLFFWGVIRSEGKERVKYCLSLIASSFCLFLCQSRSAFLGIMLSLIITGVLLKGKTYRKGLLICLAIVGFLVLMIGTDIWLPILGVRIEVWQRALLVIQDFPLTGIGMGSFEDVVRLLYPFMEIDFNDSIPHAHNLYLETAVALGIPGFIALWMIIGSWSVIAYYISGLPVYRSSVIVPGLIGGTIAYGVFGLTDAIAIGEKASIFMWGGLGIMLRIWFSQAHKKIYDDAA